MTFIQCWTNVEDVGQALYKCYTDALCLLGICNLIYEKLATMRRGFDKYVRAYLFQKKYLSTHAHLITPFIPLCFLDFCYHAWLQ